MRIGIGMGATLLFVSLSASQALAEGDAARGQVVFKKCMACHMIGPDAKNRVGPSLTGVVGRTAGTAEGYKYSPTNATAGTSGLVWTPENIAAYLPDPQKFLSDFLVEKGVAAGGRTKMAFKLTKADEIEDVIAFLLTHSPEWKPEAEGEASSSGASGTGGAAPAAQGSTQ
ncbi:MAG: c-type cytochrome [Rhizobiales bacterium]|nr:c-type cytochrome [Hyphomicrobiales bacterium]